MSKVITFSRYFPTHHPRKGKPTHFVEKIWCGLFSEIPQQYREPFENYQDTTKSILWSYRMHGIKHHTIRAGSRWKVGDKFSPRVWSGKPYNSKQIIIAPDIEIKKVWDFKLTSSGSIFINDWPIPQKIEEIATNDGLSREDFWEWFISSPSMKKEHRFVGQIICWNDSINY